MFESKSGHAMRRRSRGLYPSGLGDSCKLESSVRGRGFGGVLGRRRHRHRHRRKKLSNDGTIVSLRSAPRPGRPSGVIPRTQRKIRKFVVQKVAC